MSQALVRHGWEIVFQPQLFARQYEQLKAEVCQTLLWTVKPCVPLGRSVRRSRI
jgi:hypothetical protein